MKCEIKYAPKNLDEVIYPSIAVERRIKGYASGQLQGHVMLHGPNGTGKTSVAKLLVDAIGGADAKLESLDFEDLLVKKDLRGYMRSFAAQARFEECQKVFLLFNEFDEAKKDLNKLWTALDACGESVMMIITTNEPMKIHKSIRSRCDIIEMSGITANAALPRIQLALQAEGLKLSDQQVLCYLKKVEHIMDFRKYFKVADELLYLHSNGMQLPVWSGMPTALKVV